MPRCHAEAFRAMVGQRYCKGWVMWGGGRAGADAYPRTMWAAVGGGDRDTHGTSVRVCRSCASRLDGDSVLRVNDED